MSKADRDAITMYGTHAQATYVDRDGTYDNDRQSYGSAA